MNSPACACQACHLRASPAASGEAKVVLSPARGLGGRSGRASFEASVFVMFVIKKKSAKKSTAEWAAVKSNFVYLGCYFFAIRLAYEVCNGRLRLRA